jgi:hypothetical protein
MIMNLMSVILTIAAAPSVRQVQENTLNPSQMEDSPIAQIGVCKGFWTKLNSTIAGLEDALLRSTIANLVAIVTSVQALATSAQAVVASIRVLVTSIRALVTNVQALVTSIRAFVKCDRPEASTATRNKPCQTAKVTPHNRY